ncbi:hypothetical protein F383_02442 [Gossypium arboreum]|uniref:Uncharacterized protein n=1 Tax=Gossypium arboreum TaxID=29729 RepID=A0A0B0P4X2_GOSAR|nr:hypothetical protein F383_02442 [Gossypium arboreum]
MNESKDESTSEKSRLNLRNRIGYKVTKLAQNRRSSEIHLTLSKLLFWVFDDLSILEV